MPRMKELKKEFLKGVYLDSKCRIIKHENISVGSLNTNIVQPRDIFKTAILEDAAAIVLVHNHPSGDPTPSHDDVDLTLKIKEMGKLGFWGAIIPEEYGGTDSGYLCSVLITEAISKVSPAYNCAIWQAGCYNLD